MLDGQANWWRLRCRGVQPPCLFELLGSLEDELLGQALRFAGRIARQAPIAVSMIKRAVYQSLATDLRTSLDLASSHLAVVQSTEDRTEAMSALSEHREPVFKDH